MDVVAFGIVGEERGNAFETSGAPFYNVSLPGTDGSMNFDGIYLDPATKLPIPFCLHRFSSRFGNNQAASIDYIINVVTAT